MKEIFYKIEAVFAWVFFYKDVLQYLKNGGVPMSKIVKGKDIGNISKESLNQMLWEAVEKYSDIPAVIEPTENGYNRMSYKEFGEDIKKMGQGLMSLGVEKGDKVSLLADTRYEWVLADFAILTAGGVTATIYPTLNANSAKFIIENSDSEIVIVENEEQLEKIMEVKEELPLLKYIVTLEPTKQKQDNIFNLEEVKNMGEKYEKENPGKYEERWKSVDPDDLCSLVYTSGTTGVPKGTMISHWNFMFNVYSVISLVDFDPGYTGLNFLPLAHVYMRLVYFAAVYAGSTSCFSNPQQLAEDLPRVKPDVFVSVPRLFERVYDRIIDQMEEGSPIRKKLFYWASDVAKEVGRHHGEGKPIPKKLQRKHKLADKLVFKKIRNRMGVDNLKWTCSSGSALSKNLAYFFSGIGIVIIEGYGMTEVSAPSNLNPTHRIKPGTVGPPLPGTMQMIAEDGEILIKGDNVMHGYYKLPEETKEAFTEDGWLKTGDIGYFDEDDYLVFKERKKHILVLSTGKNVAPLPIEEELKKDRLIDDAVVIGDNQKYISALIQPSYDYLVDFAKKHGISYDEKQTEFTEGQSGDKVICKIDPKLLEHEKVYELYQEIIDRVNKNYNNFEQVKRFRFMPEALSVEKGELTPTLKVKRNVVMSKYEDLINSMYQ